MNTFLFFRYGIRMLYFFLIQSKSTNIENRVQIRPILYSSLPIRLKIFFRVSDKCIYTYTQYVLSVHSMVEYTQPYTVQLSVCLRTKRFWVRVQLQSYIHIYIYTYIHIHIYIHTDIHIYTYTQIYIHITTKIIKLQNM